MSPQITIVSAERIAAEMRAMLAGPGRARAVELLRETGLLAIILPEVGDSAARDDDVWRRTLRFLNALDRPTFPQALAVLLGWPSGAQLAKGVGARWRLANSEVERTAWLLRHGETLKNAAGQPWSRLQPILVHRGAAELMQLQAIAVRLGEADEADIVFCRQKFALSPAELDPPPLVNGEDLIALGVPKGKLYAVLLKAAREAQLDGLIHSTAEAKDFVVRQWRPSVH